jgi:hypothetical protein
LAILAFGGNGITYSRIAAEVTAQPLASPMWMPICLPFRKRDASG